MASSEALSLTGRPRGGEMVKVREAQALGLEHELLSLSKIRDGSRERNPRPLATAVFDF